MTKMIAWLKTGMFQVVWKVVWGIGKCGLRVYDLLSEILEISGATQNPSFVVSDAPPLKFRGISTTGSQDGIFRCFRRTETGLR